MSAALGAVIAPKERARIAESDSPYHEEGGVVVAIRIRGMSSSALELSSSPGALSPAERALARVLRSTSGDGGGGSDAREGAESGVALGLGAEHSTLLAGASREAESDAALLLRERLRSAQIHALHEFPMDDDFGWDDAQAIAIVTASILISLALFSKRNPCRALLGKKARPRRIQNALGGARAGQKRRLLSPLAILRQSLAKVVTGLWRPLRKGFKCDRVWRWRKRKRTSARKRREQRALVEVRETRGSTNSRN